MVLLQQSALKQLGSDIDQYITFDGGISSRDPSSSNEMLL